jgi:excisionase family DNA binding protein
MERTGIDPSLLVLELTETLLMEDRDAALEDVSRLSALGVKIAIDDFGTGYASLARLRRLPFDTLKIDRSFIADLPGARREASLVEAMVRMSRSLGLTVVAEGLETTEQLAALHALGCDEAQGLLFSSAVEGDVFADMVRMGRRWDIAAAPPREPEQPHGEAIAGLGIGGDADEPLLSLSQAATALGVSTTTVRRWSNSGELASTRTVGGHRRFPASEVRRLRAERRPPSVRVGAAPVQALPALEAIVERSGTRLGQASWASLYDDTPGFFDDPAGAPHRERWLEAVARAAHTGNYAMLIEATETLMAEARRRGAPLLERHSALERFGEATARALARGGAPHAEVVETRRLFAHLRQRHLAASD